jgi:hypothetical protein
VHLYRLGLTMGEIAGDLTMGEIAGIYRVSAQVIGSRLDEARVRRRAPERHATGDAVVTAGVSSEIALAHASPLAAPGEAGHWFPAVAAGAVRRVVRRSVSARMPSRW